MTLGEFRAASVLGKSAEDAYRELLVDPFDYYREHFEGRPIWRYIQTHPDLDHMSGLHRFFWQEEVTLENFWDVANNKKRQEADFAGTRYAFVDWAVYELLRGGTGRNDDSTHKVLRLPPGATGNYWTPNGIEILSPNKTLTDLCDNIEHWNNASYILKLTYAGRSVILPGDAESRAWQEVLSNSGEAALNCDVLKAAHHGRQTGYDEDAANAMDPQVVICSVGKEPATDATDEYEALGADVFTTRDAGTIRVKLWYDGDVWVMDHTGARLATLGPL
jgi:competence protein ComEC